jgi:beta-glucosidase
MRHRTRSRLACLPVALTLAMATARVGAAQQAIATPAAARRARALLARMTLDEKIGQLNLAAGVSLGGMLTAASDSDIAAGRVGAILWLADPKEIDRMQRVAVERSRLHIPLLFGLDVTHGYSTIFPASSRENQPIHLRAGDAAW